MIEMKKGILTLLLALTTVMGAWAGTPEKIGDIVKQYSHREGFEVMDLGRLLVGTLRAAALLDSDMDEEDRAALNAFSRVNRLVVVDFEDASEADKTSFRRKVEKVLDKMELIMEAKDSGETIRIYGIQDDTNLKDVILYSSDGTLLSVSGSIDLEHIGELMEMNQ